MKPKCIGNKKRKNSRQNQRKQKGHDTTELLQEAKDLRLFRSHGNKVRVKELNELFAVQIRLHGNATVVPTFGPSYLRYSSKMHDKFHFCFLRIQATTIPVRLLPSSLMMITGKFDAFRTYFSAFTIIYSLRTPPFPSVSFLQGESSGTRETALVATWCRRSHSRFSYSIKHRIINYTGTQEPPHSIDRQ